MITTRITTPFDHGSTAAEVIAGIELTGRRAVVTGASSGIGVETARALAGAGAEVTLAVRDVAAGRQTAAELTASTGNPGIHVRALDLTDLTSVGAFVGGWSGPLHMLVNNAGIMASPLQRTDRGWERQFATNHFGHFALATGLHESLAAAAGARVVSLSSVAHLDGGVDFDDIHFERRPYDPAQAYAQSKTANVLFAVEADRRWASDGIRVNAVHPGAIATTNLTRYYDPKVLAEVIASGRYTWKSAEQGAATSVLAAASPLLDGVGGRYFADCSEAEPYQPGGERRGVAPWALDPQAAQRLWQVSLDSLA